MAYARHELDEHLKAGHIGEIEFDDNAIDPCCHRQMASPAAPVSASRTTYSTQGGPLDDKTLTALSTMLALFQVQLNALMLLVDRYVVGLPRSDQDAIVNETTRRPVVNPVVLVIREAK